MHFAGGPEAVSIESVVLLRPSATTHNVDMEQRYVPVAFTPDGSGRLQVQMPSSQSDAPPGYYMLFIVDTSGRPSEAHFVRLNLPGLPSLERVPLATLALVFGALAVLALSCGHATRERQQFSRRKNTEGAGR